MRDLTTIVVIILAGVVALIFEGIRPVVVFAVLAFMATMYLTRLLGTGSAKGDAQPHEYRRDIGNIEVDSGSLLIGDAIDSPNAVRIARLPRGTYQVSYSVLEFQEASFISAVNLIGPGDSEYREDRAEVHVDSGCVIIADAVRYHGLPQTDLDSPIGLGERPPDTPTIRNIHGDGLMVESGEGDGSYEIEVISDANETRLSICFI